MKPEHACGVEYGAMTNHEYISRNPHGGGNSQSCANRVPRFLTAVVVTGFSVLMGLGLTGCQDFYGDVYAYRRSYFVPYERIEAERLAEERAKRDAEKAKDDATRMAAEGLMNAPAAAPMQQGGGGVGAIPGLDPIPGL